MPCLQERVDSWQTLAVPVVFAVGCTSARRLRTRRRSVVAQGQDGACVVLGIGVADEDGVP